MRAERNCFEKPLFFTSSRFVGAASSSANIRNYYYFYEWILNDALKTNDLQVLFFEEARWIARSSRTYERMVLEAKHFFK